MLVRDAVKLLFQSVMGAGHFISDNGSVSKALIAEMPEQQNRERFLGKEHLVQNSFVPLGGGYVRADLFVAYSGRMSVGRLADLFSASVSEEGDKESLKCLLEILPGMASEGIFAFGKKKLRILSGSMFYPGCPSSRTRQITDVFICLHTELFDRSF